MPDRIRLLIDDDHLIFRAALRVALCEQPDIDCVAEAADGRDAYEKAVSLGPDVVVMDVSMPLMDGVEATRRIAAERPGVKVVGLSMYTSADMAAEMARAGAVAFLTKSDSPDRLLEAIRAAASAA